jgi:hypothetical protein
MACRIARNVGKLAVHCSPEQRCRTARGVQPERFQLLPV